MKPRNFHLHLPDTITSGVVFSSPHSGRDYPAAFLRSSPLGPVAIRSSEDAFVDQLFASATDFGAPVLAASAPRAFVDLNRGVEELDPSVIDGVRSVGANPRIASGLGVIPRVVSEGRAIQVGKISFQDAKARLDKYYRPYHAQLRELLATSRAAFGQVLLIDCHSMPHEALTNSSTKHQSLPEVIIGDRFGSSSAGALVDEVESYFVRAGFRVGRNTPFAGAYITQNYGRPSSNQHAIQIEIDRSLYLDEKTVTKSENFEQVRRRLKGVIRQICDLGRWSSQLAAE